jgi:hypothetical protein
MKGAQAMLKPAVVCTRINKTGQAQLSYIPQTLKPGMLYYIENNIPRNINESIDRIINYLSFISFINHLAVY